MFQTAFSQNGISISLNGVERLGNACPWIENAPPPTRISCTEHGPNKAVFNFFNHQETQTNLHLYFFPEKSVLIFSLIYKNTTTEDNKNAIGLYFNNIPLFEQGIAMHKYGPVKAWTYPVTIQAVGELEPSDNQFFFWKYTDGVYGAAMPLLGQGYVASLGTIKENFGVKAQNLHFESKGAEIPLLAISFGSNPYDAIASLYETGLTFIGKEQGLRKNKAFPALFKNFMWCSWNAYGHSVDEHKLIQTLQSFKNKGIAMPALLIDDGWGDVTEYGTGRLQSFKPNALKFSGGLKSFIKKVKDEYGVQFVGIWHTLNGYWAGIAPGSELFHQYEAILSPYRDKIAWGIEPESDFWFVKPCTVESHVFFDDWFAYLKEQGVDFVKADNQLIAERMAGYHATFSETAQWLQSSLQNAAEKHFDGHLLNCMSMTADAVYNYENSAIARSSEDYFPHNNSYNLKAGNAAVHVLCNFYNNLWWAQMVWPDYDMFQTHHPYAHFHAVARAISGGPVYITDTPGMENAALIKKLVYSDGKIIRGCEPARPTEDCLFQGQGAKPFKVFTQSNGIGILAAFNVSDADEVSGNFCPANVKGLKGDTFFVYNAETKTGKVMHRNEPAAVTLKRMEVALFYISPLKNGFAAIGNIEKYNAPQPIVHQLSETGKIQISLYEAGTFVAFSTAQPLKIIADGIALKRPGPAPQIIEVKGKEFTFIMETFP